MVNDPGGLKSNPWWIVEVEMSLIAVTVGKCIEVFDANSHEAVATLIGHTRFINQLKFHEANEYLLGSVADDMTARVWDVATATERACFVHEADVYWISFGIHDGSNFLITRCANLFIHKWDLTSKELMFSFEIAGISTEICVCSQGRYLLTVLEGSIFRAWGTSTGDSSHEIESRFLDACAAEHILTTRRERTLIRSCAGDDTLVALVVKGFSALLMKINADDSLTTTWWHQRNSELITGLTLSGDGSKMFCYREDRSIDVLSTPTMWHQKSIDGWRLLVVHSLTTNVTGDRLALRVDSDDVIVMDVDSENELHRFEGANQPRYSIRSVVLL